MNQDDRNRIGKVENELTGLSTRMDGFEGQLGHMNSELGDIKTSHIEMNRNLNVLVNRTGGMEATRGMVPVSHILTACALFVALTSLGLKLLHDHKMTQDTKMGQVVDLENSRHLLVESQRQHVMDEIAELDEAAKDIDSRVHTIETDRFNSEQGLDLLNRISALEVEIAKRGPLIEQMLAHINELDHPYRQTATNEHQEERLREISDDIDEWRLHQDRKKSP